MTLLILLSTLGAMGIALCSVIVAWSGGERDGLLRGGLTATAALMMATLPAEFGYYSSLLVLVATTLLVIVLGAWNTEPRTPNRSWLAERLLRLFWTLTLVFSFFALDASALLYISFEFNLLRFFFSAGLAVTVGLGGLIGHLVLPRHWGMGRCAAAQTLLAGLFAAVELSAASLLLVP